MAGKKQDNRAFLELKRDISENAVKCLYIFHGEERFLLEYYLGELWKKLVLNGFEEFNHKRFDATVRKRAI